MRSRRAELPLKLPGPDAARSLFAGCFAASDPSQESIWVAHLDAGANCLHLSRHAGDASGAEFPIRSIIADAASRGSAAILLAHNHPSGDARPSEADCRATRRLVNAAEALDCTVIDHFVFAGGTCTSFRSLGLL
jgi:DNA repair protein RadC